MALTIKPRQRQRRQRAEGKRDQQVEARQRNTESDQAASSQRGAWTRPSRAACSSSSDPATVPPEPQATGPSTISARHRYDRRKYRHLPHRQERRAPEKSARRCRYWPRARGCRRSAPRRWRNNAVRGPAGRASRGCSRAHARRTRHRRVSTRWRQSRSRGSRSRGCAQSWALFKHGGRRLSRALSPQRRRCARRFFSIEGPALASMMRPALREPLWRNGRRGRLKICCWQQRAGSSPARGTTLRPYGLRVAQPPVGR